MLFQSTLKRRLILLFTLIACLLVNTVAQTSALTNQAQARAEAFFEKMYKKCGQYYYYKYIERKVFLYQCKYAPSVSVKGKVFEPRQLSEADILNSVDPLPISWEGSATIRLGLCRSQAYYTSNEPGFAAWGRWEDKFEDTVLLWNKKGVWTIYNEPMGTELYVKDVIVPVNCDDMPTENKVATTQYPTWRTINSGAASWYNGANIEVTIPANYGEWFSLGKGPMRIEPRNPYTTIFIDGTANYWYIYGGGRNRGITNSNALSPNTQLGTVIAKIGESGEPFELFSDHPGKTMEKFKIDTDEAVFVAINDSYFGDNRGEHIIYVGGLNVCLGCTEPEQPPYTPAGYRRVKINGVVTLVKVQ